MHLLENPDWQLLDPPSVNDIVNLKIEDMYHYMVRTIIMKIEDYIIIGKVDVIYDWETREPIRDSRIDSLFDGEQEFQRIHIFKIIKTNIPSL
jgi:hypothetical protein